jgi:hypothetical protein
MYTTPNKAQVNPFGHVQQAHGLGRFKEKISNAVTSAPTAKVSKLLRNTPTVWPKRPLMAACTLKTAPAASLNPTTSSHSCS